MPMFEPVPLPRIVKSTLSGSYQGPGRSSTVLPNLFHINTNEQHTTDALDYTLSL
jgi:hypothetical protein